MTDLTQTTSELRDEEADPRLLEDEIVSAQLADLSELVKDLTDDLDQMAADLDDNRLAIASSVAWLVGDNGRLVLDRTQQLRARLTYLAGLNIYPFTGE